MFPQEKWEKKGQPRETAKFCDSQIYCLLAMNTEGIEEAKVKALYNKNN